MTGRITDGRKPPRPIPKPKPRSGSEVTLDWEPLAKKQREEIRMLNRMVTKSRENIKRLMRDKARSAYGHMGMDSERSDEVYANWIRTSEILREIEKVLGTEETSRT